MGEFGGHDLQIFTTKNLLGALYIEIPIKYLFLCSNFTIPSA